MTRSETKQKQFSNTEHFHSDYLVVYVSNPLKHANFVLTTKAKQKSAPLGGGVGVGGGGGEGTQLHAIYARACFLKQLFFSIFKPKLKNETLP